MNGRRTFGSIGAVAAIAMLFLVVFSTAANARSDFLASAERARLPEITSPPVQEVVLSNGIRCFLLEDHTLPLVKISALLRAGGIDDPARQVGLAELTAMLLRSGGAGGRSAAAFDAAVDALGASIGADAGRELTAVSLEVLSGDVEEGAALLFDMLLAPRFEEKRLRVAKAALRESLRRDRDDPARLAAIDFAQLVYGAESPWARRPDDASIRRITRDAIRDFHARFFRAPNIVIAASGDFRRADFIALLEKRTAKAVQDPVVFPEVAPVAPAFAPAWKNVVRPLTQSFIRTGHLSIKRHNPDKFALFLLADILGAGNFKSRLMEDIRTKRGLAYSIWSDIDPGTDYGLFEIAVNTRAAEAGRVIELVEGHVRRLAEQGDVTKEELDFAKQSVLTQLIFEFDSPQKVVTRRAKFHFYDYPDDYWQIYRRRIAETTTQDIRRVAKEYLHPEALRTVVVGPRLADPARKAGK